MNTQIVAYIALAFAIVAEVCGSSFLVRSDGFTKPVPTLATVGFYIVAFFLLSQVVKVMPLGLAYAIWAGLGIVLTALVGLVVFKQAMDLWAMLGIALIISGVLVMNLLSQTSTH
jgi:small multidrug resistance pump